MVVLYHQNDTKNHRCNEQKKVHQPVVRVSGKPNFLQQFEVRFLQEMIVFLDEISCFTNLDSFHQPGFLSKGISLTVCHLLGVVSILYKIQQHLASLLGLHIPSLNQPFMVEFLFLCLYISSEHRFRVEIY